MKQQSLAEIYRSSELFVSLRDTRNLRGKCGRCEFRDLCGGSRARAWAMTGDVFASDPLCVRAGGGLTGTRAGRVRTAGARRSHCDNIIFIGVIMIRTQVSLSEEEYEAAKQEAERLGISLAELLRRSLRSVLPTDTAKPWMRFAGMIESGDPTASQSIDEIVYGQKD